jgi:hypothetical protein
MGVKGWLNVAGIGAGLACVGILMVVVPPFLWTGDSIVAALLLFLSLALPVLLRAPIPASSKTDAPRIWLIGPLGNLWLLLFVVSVGAVRLGLIGWHTASWVANILWLGLLISGFAMLQVATRVVESAASQTQSAVNDPRSQWAATLRKYSAQIDHGDVRDRLDSLADRMQYAANEYSGHQAEENFAISAMLVQIEAVLDKADELWKMVRSTEALLEQREVSLRAVRSRA